MMDLYRTTAVWIGLIFYVTLGGVRSQEPPGICDKNHRVNCGYPKIDETSCKKARGCCFSEDPDVPHCFYKTFKGLVSVGCFAKSKFTVGLESSIPDCIDQCAEGITHVGVTNSGCLCVSLTSEPADADNSQCQQCTNNTGLMCGKNDTATVFVYKYEQCDDNGKFGRKCDKNCYCSNNESCSAHGICSKGCKAGFKGDTCSDPCPAGSFGENCSSTCHCANSTSCNSTSGVCEDAECQPGFHSQSPSQPDCQQECTSPMFGAGCTEKCVGCAQECHHKSGCEKCDTNHINPPYCNVSTSNTDVSTPTPAGESSTPSGTEGAGPEFFMGTLVPIIGGVAGLLVLILIILICVFVHRKGRQKKLEKMKRPNENGEPSGFDEVVGVGGGLKPEAVAVSRPVSEVSNTGAPPSDDYEPMAKDPPQDHSMSVSSLEGHIKEVRKLETHPFREEYESIPEGQTSPWEFGMRKNIHREKNRFGNIVAYDHSRVHLTRKKDDTSEYINADFVDGYKQPNAFIATQGPMIQTVNDFWRMCWEHDVPIIVMVTNCIENGRQKSEQYWPELKESGTFGDITVHSEDEQIFSDFIIRSLTMKKAADKRRVKHFQFTGWPDHGVPRQATPLLTLRRRVRAEMVTKAGVTGPAVIHCSAGVGRSGTFLAVDYLINQAEAENQIDVYSCVWHMRYQRVNMVQTWDQYNFIYDALLEAVTLGQTTIPCYRFSEIYPTWLDKDPTTDVNKLEQQLRILDVVKQKLGEGEMEPALKTINRKKNRREDILPANYYRPYLQTRVEGTTDYINAVFVQGYYKREAFLITQCPLPDTRVDLWRMVYDYECCTIVCLQEYPNKSPEEVGEDNSEDTPVCWPDKGTMALGPIIITFVKSTTDPEGVVTTELTLKLGKEEPRQVSVFSVDEYPPDDVTPIPTKKQIALKDAVKRWQQQSEDRTVVLMCKYGVERCGLYCALDYVIDMMDVEQEVDIFQAVRQVQMSRPQLVPNIEQYQFLYEAAKLYMDINMAYANYK